MGFYQSHLNVVLHLNIGLHEPKKISQLFIQANWVDYTENGDECQNKCEWNQNTNSSVQFLQCLDVNGTISTCTPFESDT